MKSRLSRPQALHDAGALRFLLLFLGGWATVRILLLWNPAMPAMSEGATQPWAPPSPFSAPAGDDLAMVAAAGPRAAGRPVATYVEELVPAATGGRRPGRILAAAETMDGGGPGADRHSLRLALMARLFPSPAGAAAGSRGFVPSSPARAVPAGGEPFWIRRSLAGWSLGGWLYVRPGGTRGGIATAGQLGGSQGGFRLAYGFGESGRLRAYGRATVAIERPGQSEAALGLSFAPVARWPVDVAVEQRVAIGPGGRTALAAMVTGGVGDVALPAGFRLDAYAQAGFVGARRRDGFADGAVIVDHRIGPDESARLRLGALAAGAVQPGAARVDVGPRLTLKLPEVGDGGRIALDWRQRVAGDAAPESGVALTLAADF